MTICSHSTSLLEDRAFESCLYIWEDVLPQSGHRQQDDSPARIQNLDFSQVKVVFEFLLKNNLVVILFSEISIFSWYILNISRTAVYKAFLKKSGPGNAASSLNSRKQMTPDHSAGHIQLLPVHLFAISPIAGVGIRSSSHWPCRSILLRLGVSFETFRMRFYFARHPV